MPIPCCWRIITVYLENIVVCIYKGGVCCSSYPSEDVDNQASAQDSNFCVVLATLNNRTTYVFLYTVLPPCATQITQSGRSWQYKFHRCEKNVVRKRSQGLKIHQIYIVYCHFSGWEMYWETAMSRKQVRLSSTSFMKYEIVSWK